MLRRIFASASFAILPRRWSSHAWQVDSVDTRARVCPVSRAIRSRLAEIKLIFSCAGAPQRAHRPASRLASYCLLGRVSPCHVQWWNSITSVVEFLSCSVVDFDLSCSVVERYHVQWWNCIGFFPARR